MSEPTYRIVTQYDPHEPKYCRWSAEAFSVVTGKSVGKKYGGSEGIALDALKEAMRALLNPLRSHTYFANEDGDLIDGPEDPPEPQSLRVAP